MIAALLVTSTALVSNTLAGGDFNLPEHLSNRNVLVEPTPYPFGRARIVTASVSATPDFVISETMPFTRTPGWRNGWLNPGPTQFGAAGDDWGYAHVRIGQLPILFSGFQNYREELPAEFHSARRIWLIENGYVGAARRVVRADRQHEQCADMCGKCDKTQAALPKPRAILEIHRQDNGQVVPSEDARLQAVRTSPTHVVITSVHSETAQTELASTQSAPESEKSAGTEL